MTAINKKIDRDAVLSWFTGKAKVNAATALDLVEASLEEGSWIPGASRKVTAALSKSNLAKKLARSWEDRSQRHPYNELLGELGSPEQGLGLGWRVGHNMEFGNFRALQAIDLDALRLEAGRYGESAGRSYERSRAQLAALLRAAEYQDAMSTVAVALDRLDATRPAPKFLLPGTVSPLVQSTLDAMGAVKAEPCPMKYEEREVPVNGKMVFMTVCILLWPKGTEHHTSKKGFLGSNCEACGHRISNSSNWVPMLLTTKSGASKSLWVGRDCAKRLFEVELKGDLEIVDNGMTGGVVSTSPVDQRTDQQREEDRQQAASEARNPNC